MKKNLIILAFGFIILGCTSERKYEERFTLSAGSDLVIPLKEYSRNLSFCTQFLKHQSTFYLAVLNDKNNSIEFYDIEKKVLKSCIKIETEGENALFNITGFFAKSPDSVFAITSMPKMIGLVDSDGHVLKKISYDIDKSGRHTVPTLALGRYRAVFKDSIIFLSQEYRMHSTNGLLTDSAQMSSFVCVMVNVNTGECVSPELTYPDVLLGRDVSGMEIMRTQGYNGDFIYLFGALDSLYLTSDHLKFISLPLEINYKVILEKEHWKYLFDLENGIRANVEYDELNDIMYDHFRECYYILIRQREENLPKETDFLMKFIYPHCMVLILDKNLHYLGEVYLPDNHYSCQMMFIAPEGLYISEDHPDNPDFDEDFMRFRLFKLKKL